MGLRIPPPDPPRIVDPVLFFGSFVLGLALILLGTWLADKAGTAMFERGFAKPFYVLGRRVHHRCIYLIMPVSYLALGTMFFLGYVQIVWGAFWIKLALAVILTTFTMVLDFLGDRYWPRIRKNAVLHHEWIYTVVPAYLFTYVVHVTF